MSVAPEIVDLAQVVNPHLDGGKLISYGSRYLTKPGENYGSVILAITANIERTTGEIEELPLVAKLPPLTNDLYWQIFQPERTCITENAVYKYLAPALQQLQLEAGIPEQQLYDGLPRYYGSRISLDAKTTKVDRDAVLVQENLQTSGYKAGNRHKLFDFAHAKLVLEYMAQYHALPIALRLKKPEEFNKYVRPYFRRFNMNDTMGPEMKEQMCTETFKEIEFATNNNACAVEGAKRLFDKYDEWLTQPDAVDGPYTSLVHCDIWINNILMQYDVNGKPHKLKIVDFQIAQYESLAHDVVFFLFSSVETDVLEKNYDKFLKIYYDAFVRCLQSVHIPTKEYSYDNFLAEVQRVAPLEIPHAIFMTKIILADTSTMPEDFKDMNLSIISKNSGVAEVSKKTGDIIRLAQKYNYM